MTGEEKTISWIALCIAITLNSLIWSAAYYNVSVEKQFIQSGYEQRTLQGESGAHWVKADKESRPVK